MENWDPLELHGSATSEIVAAAKKREIKNILKSYVGFYDPFCELIQNALDSVDTRKNSLQEDGYEKKIFICINLKSNELTVIDNGIGFSEAQFKTFLSPSISFKVAGKTRGNKGVGATYLAYGFNNLQVETKTPSFQANTQFLSGREWVDDENATVARPTVKILNQEESKINHLDRGSSFTLKFTGNVRPKSLNWVGATTADQWKHLLLIKTPLGQIIEEENHSDTTFELKVIDENGIESSITNEKCHYIFPHKVIKASARIAEIIKSQQDLISQGKDATKIPAKYKKLNAVYDFWNTSQIADLLNSDEDKKLASKHEIWAYGFFCYSAVQVFDKFNDKEANLRKGLRIIRGGLQLATNEMPQGELITIPLTSNIGYQHQAHIVVHLSNADPDLGRKGFQPELQKLSGKIAASLVNKLKQWRKNLLNDNGPGTTHQEELNVDDWISAQRIHEQEKPIRLKNPNFFNPINEISITAEPTSEQDVVTLFNQLIAGGVIRGIKIMAASSHKQYDGLFKYHLQEPIENHFYDETTNPLGIENTNYKPGFVSKPYVLEFKYDFDKLITDFENEEKSETSINLTIVWELKNRYKERYEVVSLLHPENIHLRQFHGVTHELHDENTGQKRMDLIVLSELISFLNDKEAEIENQSIKYNN